LANCARQAATAPTTRTTPDDCLGDARHVGVEGPGPALDIAVEVQERGRRKRRSFKAHETRETVAELVTTPVRWFDGAARVGESDVGHGVPL
jgi:hypothetical protein